MRIKNDLVSIKMGSKQYDFNNLILNEYLNRFAKSQLDKDKVKQRDYIKELRYCLIKFDASFENINENTELHNQDFDICLVDGASNIIQELSEKEITIKYTYKTDWNVWDYKKNTALDNNISNYCGRKITAIGFNSHWMSDKNTVAKVPVCAVLDVSNYDIYLQENQELTITRKDIINSDSIFWSDSNKVKGAIHLCPKYPSPILEGKEFYKYGNIYKEAQKSFATLYSVGFSSFIDYIDKEYIVGEDIQVIQNNNELKIEGLENYLTSNKSLYPSINLYPEQGLYPRRSKYKYVIFKYKIWQENYDWSFGDDADALYEEKIIDTNCYYHQAIELNKHGLTNLKIKYERN